MTDNILTDETTVTEAEEVDITTNETRESSDSSEGVEYTDTPEVHSPEEDKTAIDYERLMKEDVDTLRSHFPELADIGDITDLDDPLRYAALRDLGLTPAEAYRATAKRAYTDTRSHLKRAHGKNASGSTSLMSPTELMAARDIFPDKSDAEIQRLYKRVSG